MLCGVALAFALAPAAASADVTVSLSGPKGPLPKGTEADYTARVTNTSGVSESGLSLLIGSFRVEGDRPVPNPYSAFSSNCSAENFPTGFGTYYSLSCALPTLGPGASTQVRTSAEINESMRQYADIDPGDERANLVTYVSAPPVVEGSKKVKLKGLPDGCASEDFKLKVKAKGAKKITGRIDGPRDADGKPAEFGEGTSDKFKAAKSSKLKTRIAVADLVPDAYYEISVAAKYDGKPKQKSVALVQVCA